MPNATMGLGAGGSDAGDMLNLQNLYPQSQSPMSFKQIQNVKRQKRANNINITG